MEQKERTWHSVNGAARHAVYVSNQGKSNGTSSGKQENDFDISFESRNLQDIGFILWGLNFKAEAVVKRSQ